MVSSRLGHRRVRQATDLTMLFSHTFAHRTPRWTSPGWCVGLISISAPTQSGGVCRTRAPAATRRPLRGAGSAARARRWRLATRSAEKDRANGTAAVPADTRDRDAGSVLRSLTEDPVGTAAAHAWDEAHARRTSILSGSGDAAAHRDNASIDEPGGDLNLRPAGAHPVV